MTQLKRYGIIYKITNKSEKDKCYIGQTTGTLASRLIGHLNKYNKSYISSALKKYGIESFDFEEMYSAFTKEELDRAEQLYIEQFQSLSTQKGYNLKLSGNQPRLNSDAIKRMAATHRGAKHTNNKPVKITNTETGEITYIRALEDIKDSKEFRIKGIRKLLAVNKHNYKKYHIEYISKSTYVNQSGSIGINKSKHAQRLETETVTTEYKVSTSHRVPKLAIKDYIETIIDLYVNKKVGTYRLSKMFGFDKGTILRHLQANNINTSINQKTKRNIR